MTDERFEWDDAKAEANRKKHGIDFRTATAVFDDPRNLTEFNGIEDGEYRWQTVGLVMGVLFLLVIHTDRWRGSAEVIRIISARKATKAERKDYETQDR